MVVISSNFTAPVDGILCEQPLTKLLVNDHEVGTGTLYVTEQSVVWGGGTLVAGGSAPTLSLQYRTISLHAVQREPSAALYMVLNYELKVPEFGITETGGAGDSTANDDDDDDEDIDDIPITQLRFVPQNESSLATMYAAMSHGQSLHPDPQDEVGDDDPYMMDGEDDDEGNGDEIFEDAEESNPAPEDATSRLRQLNLENSNGHNMYDEFSDADEFEETADD